MQAFARAQGRYIVKFKSGSILFVLLILAAITIAGCTSSSNSGTSPTPSPTLPAPTPTPTPVPAIGSTLNVTNMIDLTQVHWYAYKITPSGTVMDLGSGFTTAGATMTERWDLNVDFNGQNADKVTGTGNYPSNGYSGNTIEFLNHTDHGRILDGNLTLLKNGNAVYTGAITPKLQAIQSLLDLNNSTYTGTHTVTYEGTESVTVPMGTYDTTKYLYAGDYTLTVYMGSSVPVPIKVDAVNTAGTIYTVELTGWG
jgi:hypothetical protein